MDYLTAAYAAAFERSTKQKNVQRAKFALSGSFLVAYSNLLDKKFQKFRLSDTLVKSLPLYWCNLQHT